MTGKIYLASIRDYSKIPKNCIKLFIARKPLKNIKAYDFKPALSLAPSSNLLSDYKNGKIVWYEYVERYKQEMKLMANSLRIIYNHLKIGENISFICYCPNSKGCHRSLLGEYFEKLNIEIIDVI